MTISPATKLMALICWLAGGLPSSAQAPPSYSQYYKKNVGRAAANPNAYLFDKYYKQKSYISPYANLGRRTASGNSYQTYIRPEQQRRAAAQAAGRQYVQQRKMQGNVGQTNYGFAKQLRYGGVPSASSIPTSKQPSTYYNHYYGGGQR